jgi:hypothetical protein
MILLHKNKKPAAIAAAGEHHNQGRLKNTKFQAESQLNPPWILTRALLVGTLQVRALRDIKSPGFGGRGYGRPSIEDLVTALAQFPRFEL